MTTKEKSLIDKLDISTLSFASTPSEEQETTINWNRTDSVASICTNDSTTLTMIKKLVKNNPKDWKIVKFTYRMEGEGKNAHEEVTSITVECPKKLVSMRTGGQEREMSEEQKEKMRARLLEWRASQSKQS